MVGGDVLSVLRRAKARLTPATWAQGFDASIQPDRFCLAQAIVREADYTAGQTALKLVARLVSGRSDGDTRAAQDWNDHPDRTIEDIWIALDAAIEIARQQRVSSVLCQRS